MTLKAEIMYKSNWQQGSLKGMDGPVLDVENDAVVDDLVQRFGATNGFVHSRFTLRRRKSMAQLGTLTPRLLLNDTLSYHGQRCKRTSVSLLVPRCLKRCLTCRMVATI